VRLARTIKVELWITSINNTEFRTAINTARESRPLVNSRKAVVGLMDHRALKNRLRSERFFN
jgi:hypothetical protein